MCREVIQTIIWQGRWHFATDNSYSHVVDPRGASRVFIELHLKPEDKNLGFLRNVQDRLIFSPIGRSFDEMRVHLVTSQALAARPLDIEDQPGSADKILSLDETCDFQSLSTEGVRPQRLNQIDRRAISGTWDDGDPSARHSGMRRRPINPCVLRVKRGPAFRNDDAAAARDRLRGFLTRERRSPQGKEHDQWQTHPEDFVSHAVPCGRNGAISVVGLTAKK